LVDLDDLVGNEGTAPLNPYEDESCAKDDSQFFDEDLLEDDNKDAVEDEADCMIIEVVC